MQTLLSLTHTKTQLYYVIFMMLMGSSFTYTLLCIPVWIAEQKKFFYPKIKYFTVFYTVAVWTFFSVTWVSNQSKFINKAVLHAPITGLVIAYLAFIVKGYSRSKILTLSWYLLMPPLGALLVTMM